MTAFRNFSLKIIFATLCTLGISGNVYPKTVVIGAGLSGLTVAYRMMQAGEEVEIFEARKRAGGRVFTIYLNGAPQELGGENLSDGGEAKEIISLAEELGLSIDSYSSTVTTYFYDFETSRGYDVYHDLALNFPPVTQEMETRLDQIVKQSTHLQDVLNQFLKNDPILRRLYESRMTTYEGSEPIHLAASYGTQSFLSMLRFTDTRSRQITERKPVINTMQKIHGGNACLVKALISRLGKRVRYNSPLKQVARNNQKRLTLSFIGKQKPIQAEKVVLTLPSSLLKEIQFSDHLLPTQQEKRIKTASHGNSAKILFPLKTTRGALAQGMTSWSSIGSSVTVLYLGGETAILNSPADFSNISKKGLSILMDAQPVSSAKEHATDLKGMLEIKHPIEKQFSSYLGPVGVSWPAEPYTKMGYSKFAPGEDLTYGTRVEVLGESVIEMYQPVEEKLFFAGEHTALDYNGTLQGAVESGERTARMLLRALNRRLKSNREGF